MIPFTNRYVHDTHTMCADALQNYYHIILVIAKATATAQQRRSKQLLCGVTQV